MSTATDPVVVVAADVAGLLAPLLPFADVVIAPGRGKPAVEWFAQFPGLGGVLVLGTHGCTVWFRDGTRITWEGPIGDPVAVATFAHRGWAAGYGVEVRPAS